MLEPSDDAPHQAHDGMTEAEDRVPAIRVEGLSKSYADVRAVDDLTFELHHGEIFGLLGPNGAGKTTALRMVLDIIKPTSGRISVLGGPMDEAKKSRIGYLPEERGLYDDMTLWDTLRFMGRLKGLSRGDAEARAEALLDDVGLADVRERKIEALSRGMAQKAQFVAATMHDPDLLIIDEPFSGLDPVNTRVIKQLIYRMRDRGSAVVMSTHQMHRVEEMCDRILLIDRGRRALYGPLGDIRRRYTDHAVEVDVRGELDGVTGVRQISRRETPAASHRTDGDRAGASGRNGGQRDATEDPGDAVVGYRLLLEHDAAPSEVLMALVRRPDVIVERFERVETSLEEIFVQVVSRDVDPEDLRA